MLPTLKLCAQREVQHLMTHRTEARHYSFFIMCSVLFKVFYINSVNPNNNPGKYGLMDDNLEA